MNNDPFRTMHEHSADAARERRIGLILNRVPERMRHAVVWLRQPQARWVRIPAGVLLLFGGVLSILPVFGLWMLPLGVVLLAEDVKPLQRLVDRALEWVERRHPRWMGLDEPNASARDHAR